MSREKASFFHLLHDNWIWWWKFPLHLNFYLFGNNSLLCLANEGKTTTFKNSFERIQLAFVYKIRRKKKISLRRSKQNHFISHIFFDRYDTKVCFTLTQHFYYFSAWENLTYILFFFSSFSFHLHTSSLQLRYTFFFKIDKLFLQSSIFSFFCWKTNFFCVLKCKQWFIHQSQNLSVSLDQQFSHFVSSHRRGKFWTICHFGPTITLVQKL